MQGSKKCAHLCLLESKFFVFIITESEVVLCDFHREKAWWEWTSKTSNGVLNRRDEVLSRLRRIAKASTMEQMETAIKDLKESVVWAESPRLRSWFETKWLPAKKVRGLSDSKSSISEHREMITVDDADIT